MQESNMKPTCDVIQFPPSRTAVSGSLDIKEEEGNETAPLKGAIESNKYEKPKRHGKWRSRTYRSWEAMRSRCRNENHRQYHDYGGRGITVCEAWDSFATFLEDMDERPEGKTLDRIDADGPYCPENCEWATHKSQARNRRSNRLLTHSGETLALAEWAERGGINPSTFRSRINAGWSVEQALTTGARKKGEPGAATGTATKFYKTIVEDTTPRWERWMVGPVIDGRPKRAHLKDFIEACRERDRVARKLGWQYKDVDGRLPPEKLKLFRELWTAKKLGLPYIPRGYEGPMANGPMTFADLFLLEAKELELTPTELVKKGHSPIRLKPGEYGPATILNDADFLYHRHTEHPDVQKVIMEHPVLRVWFEHGRSTVPNPNTKSK